MLDKYTEKKKRNQHTARFTEKNVSVKTQKRISECGTWLQSVTDKELSKMKICAANFCKNRFCPFCAWNKSKKDAMIIGISMEYLAKEHRLEFIFLTLTAPNVKGEDLNAEITEFNKAFKRFVELDAVEQMNQGYIRKLEITYNEKRNDYHIHFHCVIAVNKKYFKDQTYIKQAEWLKMWRSAKRDDSITQVDVRKVKLSGSGKGIPEFAKYAAKDDDYTVNQEVFDTFYKALKGRQVITYNRLFKDANAKYKAGELDHYKIADKTEYFYMLLHRWGNGQYIENSRRELGEDEKIIYSKGQQEEVQID